MKLKFYKDIDKIAILYYIYYNILILKSGEDV